MMVSFRDVMIALEFFDQCERTLRGRVVRVTQSWKQAVFFIGRLLRRGSCKIANAASSSAHRAGVNSPPGVRPVTAMRRRGNTRCGGGTR